MLDRSQTAAGFAARTRIWIVGTWKPVSRLAKAGEGRFGP